MAEYQCPGCGKTQWHTDLTLWHCVPCGRHYPCVNGIPKLYIEANLGEKDRELRDRFYGGVIGVHYQKVMPFLTLPARPAAISWRGWLAYATILAILAATGGYVAAAVLINRRSFPSAATTGA